MIDLKALQERTFANKVAKGFNTTDVYLEFCLLHEEVSEACHSHYKKDGKVAEELADVGLYLLGIAQILGVDLEEELLKKMAKNENREYAIVDGVWTRTKEG